MYRACPLEAARLVVDIESDWHAGKFAKNGACERVSRRALHPLLAAAPARLA